MNGKQLFRLILPETGKVNIGKESQAQINLQSGLPTSSLVGTVINKRPQPEV